MIFNEFMVDTSIAKSALNTEISAIASSPLFPELTAFRQSSIPLGLNNGQLTADLQTSSKAATEPPSSAQLTTNISNFLQQIQGSGTFDRGQLTINATMPAGDLKGSFSSQDTEKLIRDFVKGISGRVPFTDGKINVDLPTELGGVKGSIAFGNGALVTDLSTPSGRYFSSIDFRESDQFRFNLGNIPGTVNFNDGLVILDAQPQTPGDEIAIPINALSGDATFKDGQATFNFPTPFGAAAANLDLSTLATTAATDIFQGSGAVNVTNGVVTIDMKGSSGTMQRTFDLPKLTQNFGSTLAIT